MREIYQPAEDSYFLSDVLKRTINEKNIKVIDVGSGSGIQAETLINMGVTPKDITLIDVNEEVIKYLLPKFNQSKIIQSNLFQNVKSKFDVIIFNPPYLPENKEEPKDSKLATTGGKKGSEIINKFLEQVRKHLNKDGKIILLTSNLTKGINWLDYKKKLIEKKKLFFEELRVWEITQNLTPVILDISEVKVNKSFLFKL